MVALMALASACASASASRADRGSPFSPIEATELRASGASNVYDAVSRLRPSFFATRGGTSFLNEPADKLVVIVGQTVEGGVAVLRDIDPRIVRTVRKLSASDVYQLTGRSAPDGGIQILFVR
jgi:hypothetical protein